MLRISVVICTHNRADFLRKAIQSLVEQTLGPVTDYEVVVVDNASTDWTPAVVEEFRVLLPGIHYIYEARIGLSWARNIGAQVASAPYVAYLDDDAQAQCDWLEQIVRAFEQVVPVPAAVGGRVWLDWGGDVPAWLPRRYWSLYTYLDLGDAGHVLRSNEYLVGANIAFRKDILLDLGAFDTDLGRKGIVLRSGEEADVLRRLSARNFPIYYAPQAVVMHTVSQERLQKNWLRKRLFWDGASQPLLDHLEMQARRFYLFQTYCDVRRLAFFSWQWLRARLRGNTPLAEESAWALAQRMGRLRTNLLLAWNRYPKQP